MIKKREPMKLQNLLVLSLLTILTIAGCGGSDSKNETSPSTETTIQEPLVIDGHTLPPDPGEVGKATLLGIDSNDNGVRDDVERAIYLTYQRPVERAYMMQASQLFNKYLENPVEAAKSEILEAQSFKNSACEGYLEYVLNIKINDYSDLTIEFIENNFMNTLDRIKAYNEFNQASSGGVYTVPGLSDLSESTCDFNVTQLIEQE